MTRALLAVLLAGCATTPAQAPLPPVAPRTPAVVSAPAPAAPSPPDDLQFCVDETNRYRARLGLPALARSADLEAFAAQGARVDARIRRPHQHFSGANFPRPFSQMGENEIPWWPLARYGSVREVMRQGIEGMFAEGPGGGHHDNMVGPFTALGCGVLVDGGDVTVVQDFLRP